MCWTWMRTYLFLTTTGFYDAEQNQKKEIETNDHQRASESRID
jgi:hypothetical protein